MPRFLSSEPHWGLGLPCWSTAPAEPQQRGLALSPNLDGRSGAQWRRSLVPSVSSQSVATVTFPLAVLLPFFTLSPSFGDVMVDAILAYLFPGSTDPRTYCVLGGIAALFMDGDVVVAVRSVAILGLIPVRQARLALGRSIPTPAPKLSLVRKLEALGPWSMADVFVVSVLVVAFKGFPGGTAFTIEIGYYVFLVSVVTGLLATWLAKRRLERRQTQRQEAMVPLKAAACVKAADHVRIRRPAVPAATGGAPPDGCRTGGSY